MGQGIACDPSGCIGRLADGQLVSYALTPDAFEDDCGRAAVVVAAREAPPGCAANVISRRRGVPKARWRCPATPGILPSGLRAADFDRPWSPAPVSRSATDRSASESATTRTSDHALTRRAMRTPRSEDLEASID